LAVALFVAATGPAVGEETAKTPDASEIEKTLESRKGELKKVESRSRELERAVADIATEREKLNKRLVETAALVQRSEAQMTAIETRLEMLGADEAKLRGSLNARYGEIAKLLSALQRMGRNPPPVMITKREDALKMVRSAMLLAAAFPEMKGQALALAKKLDDLMRVMTESRQESERLKIETTRLNDMRTKLASLLEVKKQSLGARQAELTDARNTASELSKSVDDLNDLIAKLDQQVTKSEALRSYEEESRRELAAAAPATAPTAAALPAAPPGADLTGSAGKSTEVAALMPPPKASDPSVVELAPGGASLVLGNPGRIKPAMPFELAKGRLPLPAQGRRVLSYGEKTQYGASSKGVVIETRASAQVISPCDGWIVYAGEFRSYGQLLIINASGGYHVLVAGLSQIDVQPGQFVLTAEPVGTMSGPRLKGSSQATPVATGDGSAKSSLPVLYVEFRKDGQPIDPDPWWVDAHQKVQG
jgi:septal ring factor EnvC (AmiA/AmiB activator)